MSLSYQHWNGNHMPLCLDFFSIGSRDQIQISIPKEQVSWGRASPQFTSIISMIWSSSQEKVEVVPCSLFDLVIIVLRTLYTLPTEVKEKSTSRRWLIDQNLHEKCNQ